MSNQTAAVEKNNQMLLRPSPLVNDPVLIIDQTLSSKTDQVPVHDPTCDTVVVVSNDENEKIEQFVVTNLKTIEIEINEKNAVVSNTEGEKGSQPIAASVMYVVDNVVKSVQDAVKRDPGAAEDEREEGMKPKVKVKPREVFHFGARDIREKQKSQEPVKPKREVRPGVKKLKPLKTLSQKMSMMSWLTRTPPVA